MPQVKYTYQGVYGTVWTAAIENPEPQMVSRFGSVAVDSNTIPGISPCSTTGNTAANLPATTACVGSAAFFNPLQASWPELTGTARINQPWGRLQVGLMMRNNRLNDGQYLNQDYLGYAGMISGNAHPFSGATSPWARTISASSLAPAPMWGASSVTAVGAQHEFREHHQCAGFRLCQPADQRAVEHGELRHEARL